MDFKRTLPTHPEVQQFVDQVESMRTNPTPYSSNQPLSDEEQQAVLAEVQAAQPKPLNSFANHIQGRITPTKDNWWWVAAPNAISNLGDISTGLVHVATHFPEEAKRFIDYEKRNHQNVIREAKMAKQMMKDGTMTPADYINYIGQAMYASPFVATTRDFLNAVGTPYALKTTTPVEFIEAGKKEGLKGVAKQGVKQAKETVKSVLESPVDVGFDLLGTGVVSKIKKAAPIVKEAEQAEKALNVGTAKVSSDLNKVNETLKEAKKVQKAENIDMADLVKRAEETGDWTGVPVTVRKKFKDFSDQYNEIAKKHSPQTAVDPEHLTVAQNIARKRNITYRDAEKSIQALYDSIPEGVDRNIGLRDLAKSGDKLAQEVIDAKQGFHEGRLFPITHAMKDKVAIDGLNKIADDERLYSGRFSTREYGLHKYEDIAKALAKPDEFLEALGKQYVGNNIKQELLNGTINGESIKAAKEADNVYIPRKMLEDSSTFEKIQKEASKTPTSVEDVAISKHLLNSLATQTKGVAKVFGSDLLNDMYNVGKGSMLASGTYLGANIIGGGINAMMSSGLHTLDDLAQAIKTQGKLSKELGTYRNVSELRPVKTKWLQPVQKLNKYTTGAVTELLDRKIQNLYSEMAAHRQLRELGVASKNRLRTLDNLDAQRLGDVIEGVKSEALLNSFKTTLPKTVVEIGQAANPFWRWNDTAARSTLYMLEHHPITSNLIMNQTLARIGFDQEMQDRLNLNVKSDKKGVSYFFDDRTGQVKEASIEWIPQMNTFKLLANPSEFFKDNPTQSATFMKLANAWQGKDQYGRPLKRADRNRRMEHPYDNRMGVRYVMTPQGMVKQGGRLDEVAATFAKETIGILNAMNKTALPIAASLTGNKFYQPYAQSLFGSISNDDRTTNFLSGGDPRKPREFANVFQSLLGLYSQPYIPALQEQRPLTPQQGKRLIRANRFDLLRKQRGY